MHIEDLGAFDDEALRVFLDPSDGGVSPGTLGRSLRGASEAVVRRVLDALPQRNAETARAAVHAAADPALAAAAEREVVEQLFWPLLYWTAPEEYVELVRDENINPALVDLLPLDGAVVCDIGAGAGRCTLDIARRASHVIAVDAVPALLSLLRTAAERAHIANITTRRGAFSQLPLDDGAVDIAIACSSFMTTGPHGGERALHEAVRITRPGGIVAVIWPQDPQWFCERGFEEVVVTGDDARDFGDVATAERLCAEFYSEDAADWVRTHATARVPFSVLGMLPPNSMCLLRVPVTPSR
jgi:ubiquinone/menaquinone biosynthesis C-methylase UbiE